MNKTKVIVGLLTILGVVCSPVRVSADTTYPLLIGEWSDLGDCNKTRFIFTQDNHYFWLEKQSGSWQTLYDGAYGIPGAEYMSEVQRSSPEAIGAVVVGEGFNTGGSTLEIHELTQSTFIGEWRVDMNDELSFENPEDALVNFERCPAR